jgi:hypothetical protein
LGLFAINVIFYRDSGINEESSNASENIILRPNGAAGTASNGTAAVVMRKSGINNSLLDLTDASEKLARRGSVGSLDSGMSISFQSNSMFNGNGPNNGNQQNNFNHHHNHQKRHHHHSNSTATGSKH